MAPAIVSKRRLQAFRNLVGAHVHFKRNGEQPAPIASNQLMIKLLFALFGILAFALILVGVLFTLRYRRRSRQVTSTSLLRANDDGSSTSLPLYDEKTRSSFVSHRRLTVTTGKHDSFIFVQEQRGSPSDSDSLSSPKELPEIRITFPEEFDDAGKRKSGRVVVVRMGEHGAVGLEPLHDDDLPPYNRAGFQSLDLDRIGGLTEKETGTSV